MAGIDHRTAIVNRPQAHQPNEFIEKSQFEAGHKFMQKLLERLTGD